MSFMQKRQQERQPCHWIVRETIEEEIAARNWSEPAFMIAELAQTTEQNAKALLSFQGRLTGIQCMMMDKAFGLSDGFFSRLQRISEKTYPPEFERRVQKRHQR